MDETNPTPKYCLFCGQRADLPRSTCARHPTAAQGHKSAHTPGPWEVVRHTHVDGELWLSVNQQADAAGMKEWIAEIKYLTTNEARQWANAKLIAAAPDLLEACRRLLKFNEDLCADVRISTHYPSADFARKAITKAEGTQS